MGEIAQHKIEGRMCEWCGVWLDAFLDGSADDGYGHPVVCRDCWYDATPTEREGHQREYPVGRTARKSAKRTRAPKASQKKNA